MKLNELEKQALEAINKVFSDQSGPPENNLDALRGIRDELNVLIDTLEQETT